MQTTDGFSFVQAPPGIPQALTCAALDPLARHLFTTRAWGLGSPNGGSAGDWAEVAAALDVDAARLVRLRQVHGAAVVVRRVDASDAPTDELPEADVIVSNDPRAAIAIQTADCVPLLIVDRAGGAVGAAHAGWRGLAACVPQVAVRAMADAFGSAPRDLVVAIGPSISAARYEVGRDVRERFEAAGFGADQLDRWFTPADRPEHWLFDGWQSAVEQTTAAGVPRGAIHLAALCTASYPDLFCSYRRDGKGAGRMAAAIRPRG